ncbi:hypothetical protein PRK78_007073 [Emydomyces testavorans]|uniref:Uncharacterized protein n=1 Tax=Emydomyces testavorans TaxID=2070801 RepID=A0AAF0DPK4_9EURO|nr:hypothetical protein PRK78_007073 [Emydomyces testavorans]
MSNCCDLIHDDSVSGSLPSSSDQVARDFSNRLQMIESELKATTSRIAYHEERIQLQKETIFAWFDKRFAIIDTRFDRINTKLNVIEGRFNKIKVRFNEIETSLNRKFEHIEMLFKTTVADILKQQKEKENRMLSRLLFSLASMAFVAIGGASTLFLREQVKKSKDMPE